MKRVHEDYVSRKILLVDIFLTDIFIMELENIEKQDRNWLIYSKVSNKVYCFYCKLFDWEQKFTHLSSKGLIIGGILGSDSAITKLTIVTFFVWVNKWN